METSPYSTEGLRADARRNRARVLTAAARALSEEGLSVSLGQIAERAGVGAGTVYRHFPTKDSLLEAVLSQRLERLARLARKHGESADPGEAFFGFFTAAVTSTPNNSDLCELLEAADGWPRTVMESSGRRLNAALGGLLSRAQAAGRVRSDLTPEDLRDLLTGCVAIQRRRPDPETLAPAARLLVSSMRSGVTETRDDERNRDENKGSPSDRNAAGERLCRTCGKTISSAARGRPARYCNAACRQKAYRQRAGEGRAESSS